MQQDQIVLALWQLLLIVVGPAAAVIGVWMRMRQDAAQRQNKAAEEESALRSWRTQVNERLKGIKEEHDRQEGHDKNLYKKVHDIQADVSAIKERLASIEGKLS